MHTSIPNIVVLYDSITNSVCESQVIRPRYGKEPLHIISFERNLGACEPLRNALCERYPDLQITVIPRWPYLCRLQLWWAGRRLARVVKQFPAYTLIARGAYAAVIAERAARQAACRRLVIQVRGLLAAEYRYSQSTHLMHRLRAAQLESLERYAYQLPGELEVVSKELGDIIVTIFGVQRAAITVATQDVPAVLSIEQRAEDRAWARTQLNIPKDAWVICYSGSVAPWQCIDESYRYACAQLAQRSNSILLFLVPERDIARVTQYHGPHVRVHAAQPTELLRFLCAADVGILLREPHVMNWVSRPTKALEYRAAGVAIIHNNTVQMLVSDE